MVKRGYASLRHRFKADGRGSDQSVMEGGDIPDLDDDAPRQAFDANS